MNRICVNNTIVIIDCFLSVKYTSLVVVFNNSKQLTGINTRNTHIIYNGRDYCLKFMEIDNKTQHQGFNGHSYFNKGFHMDIGIIENINDNLDNPIDIVH